MLNEEIIDNKDLIIMKLTHYFITDKNYNPIIIRGIDNEIWLENLTSDYEVIRIVSRHIHNNEQLNFDRFKLGRIIKKLKVKTLSLKLKVLNIYTDIGDDVNLSDNDIFISKEKDIPKSALADSFPDIVDKINYKEKGIELFAKITDDINRDSYQKSKKAEKLFSRKKPIVTYTIIAICAVIFLLTYILGDGPYDNLTLLKFGANLDILTKNGQFYRLLTCSFLHIGLLHLLFNMYALLVIGSQIESFFGKVKYIIIYVISAICGSLLSLAFSPNTISAGASGAIFGLLGSLLYFGYYYRAYLGNVIRSQILPIIILNLGLGFMMNGIDNAAHIGGLIGGIFTSMALEVSDKSKKQEQINGIIILIIYIGFIIYLGFFH